jgi:hypothetical protein
MTILCPQVACLHLSSSTQATRCHEASRLQATGRFARDARSSSCSFRLMSRARFAFADFTRAPETIPPRQDAEITKCDGRCFYLFFGRRRRRRRHFSRRGSSDLFTAINQFSVIMLVPHPFQVSRPLLRKLLHIFESFPNPDSIHGSRFTPKILQKNIFVFCKIKIERNNLDANAANERTCSEINLKCRNHKQL